MMGRWQEGEVQAFRILQFAFILLFLFEGLDKFFYLMANWSQYLPPYLLHFFGGHARVAITLVGVIDIGLAIGLLYKPKPFAYLASLWLLAIAANGFFFGHHFDIALREFVFSLAALSLGRLNSKTQNSG
ncbi:MAG: hypothetical protein KGI80_03450 [Verrucomicrobiota bacterium]|nr:hypothetical protein [Verrucomicrobiota bacterium]